MDKIARINTRNNVKITYINRHVGRIVISWGFLKVAEELESRGRQQIGWIIHMNTFSLIAIRELRLHMENPTNVGSVGFYNKSAASCAKDDLSPLTKRT